MSTFQFAQGRPLAALISGAAGGLSFGLVMAWLNLRGERGLARLGVATDNMDPIQERSVEFAAPADLAFAASRLAMLSLPKVKISRDDPQAGELDGTVGMSTRSFGEILKVRVIRSGASASRISIRSEPRMKTTAVDYGKSVENVETVLKELRSRLPA